MPDKGANGTACIRPMEETDHHNGAIDRPSDLSDSSTNRSAGVFHQHSIPEIDAAEITSGNKSNDSKQKSGINVIKLESKKLSDDDKRTVLPEIQCTYSSTQTSGSVVGRKCLRPQRASLLVPPFLKTPTISVNDNEPLVCSGSLLTVPGMESSGQGHGSGCYTSVFTIEPKPPDTGRVQGRDNFSPTPVTSTQTAQALVRDRTRLQAPCSGTMTPPRDSGQHSYTHTYNHFSSGGTGMANNHMGHQRTVVTETTIHEEEVPVIMRRRGCTLRVKITSITDEDLEEFERECVGCCLLHV